MQLVTFSLHGAGEKVMWQVIDFGHDGPKGIAVSSHAARLLDPKALWPLLTLRLSRTGMAVQRCAKVFSICVSINDYRQVKLGVKAASRKLMSVDSFDNCEEKCREVALVLTGLHRQCLTPRLSWASILANGMTSHSTEHHGTLNPPLALGTAPEPLGATHRLPVCCFD